VAGLAGRQHRRARPRSQKAVSWPPLSTENAGTCERPEVLVTCTPSWTTVASCPVVRTEVSWMESGGRAASAAPTAAHDASAQATTIERR